ncbi:hypothetical protein V5O48_001366 [Marasmius crinis-equi]|uniref:Methyltransferase domain-containing protein n=1 Tax=Marasmius crinis-equi TaxID=585013 RepID=A0ABR3FZA2_9AGAR
MVERADRPKRPPLFRSQSDSNPSFTKPAIHNPQEEAIPIPTFLGNSHVSTDYNAHRTPITSPDRPPRNPARAVVVEHPIAIQSPIPAKPARKLTLKSKRPRTATGTREEVTPWELHPPPDSYGGSSQKFPVNGLVSGSTVEQPAPRRILPPPRPTTSSGSNTGISFPDISLLRRKSTGSKLQRPKTSTGAHVLHKPRAQAPASSPVPLRQDGRVTPRHSPQILHATPRTPQSAIATPKDVLETHIEHQAIPEGRSLSQSSSSVTDSSSFGLHKSTSRSSSEQFKNNLKFSTADRTILEELKRNLQARASQFVTKGGTPGLNMAETGVASTFNMGKAGGVGGGRRHHAYPKDEVPYPRSYDREVLDLDVWETLFCNQICSSLTWHEFDEPPTRVLDIGCGTGSWILDCARVWRRCHFVGLDVVPLHPDLIQVGSLDLAQRITWVQHNFLEGLPFPNEEFDFVHIKRIARGVPEDKWDFLFEEITRVMKPGGAFEMIEEDLFFPGRRDGDDENAEEAENNAHSSPWSSRRPSRRGSTTAASQNSISSPTRRLSGTVLPSGSDLSDFEDLDAESIFTNSTGSAGRHRLSDEVGSYAPNTSATSATLNPVVAGKSGPNTISMHGREVGAISEDEEGELRADSGLPTPPGEKDTLRPRLGTDSTIRPTSDTVKKPTRSRSRMHSEPPSFFGEGSSISSGLGLPPPTAKPKSPPSFLSGISLSSSLALGFLDSQANLAVHLSPPNRMAAPVPRHRAPLSSSQMASSEVHHPHSSDAKIRARSPSAGTSKPVSPFLLRQLPRPPINPRDHSLLKMIYNEMHASRFINLSPLSILPNMLSLHFQDVRTHPPLQFTFPPRSTVQPPDDLGDSPHYHPDPTEDPGTETPDSVSPTPATTGTQQTRVRRHSSAASSQKHFFLPKPIGQGLNGQNGDDELDEENFLSVRKLIQGTSPYVSLDDSRSSAFSPHSRASFLRTSKSRIDLSLSDSESDALRSPLSPGSPSSIGSPPKPTPFAIAASASMLRNSLPNQRLNVDLRSLNLHLWARVAEIIACSETMWEWVLEYQKKERAKGTRTQRARSKSIDVVQPRLYSPAPETATDKLEASLAALTREEYEDLLLRFYLWVHHTSSLQAVSQYHLFDSDMQDHMEIESTMEKRFDWSTFRKSPSAERDHFDDACKRYVLWKHEQHSRLERVAKSPRARPLSASYASTNASVFSSFTSMSQETLDGLPSPSDATASTSGLPPQSLPHTLKDGRRRDSASSYFAPRSPSYQVSPEPRRLSRSLRVFVAWKPE